MPASGQLPLTQICMEKMLETKNVRNAKAVNMRCR